MTNGELPRDHCSEFSSKRCPIKQTSMACSTDTRSRFVCVLNRFLAERTAKVAALARAKQWQKAVFLALVETPAARWPLVGHLCCQQEPHIIYEGGGLLQTFAVPSFTSMTICRHILYRFKHLIAAYCSLINLQFTV